jgi:hypothetical protein
VCLAFGQLERDLEAAGVGERVGLKQVDDALWLVSFMDYDLGYIDLEQKTLQTLDNPFGTTFLPMS